MKDASAARESGSHLCPFCGLGTCRHWRPVVVGFEGQGARAWRGMGREVTGISSCFCDNCGQPTIWRGDERVWPPSPSAPPANDYMPTHVRQDFEEARQVFDRSPRSAGALLRLALEKLWAHLEWTGSTLGDGVRGLVDRGVLPATVQWELEAARVVGDERVPPGMVDDRDDRDSALVLFELLNTLVEKLIAEPARWRRP